MKRSKNPGNVSQEKIDVPHEQIIGFAEQCESDPVFFIKYFLKINLSPAQEKLIESMHINPLTVAIFARQCVAAGTLVTMADGRQLPIETLCAGDKILSYNRKTERFESDTVTDKWATEPKPAYEITTLDGRNIVCSEDHRFLSPTGWNSIKTGMYPIPGRKYTTYRTRLEENKISTISKGMVAVPRLRNLFHSDKLSESHARFLGYFMADGSYTKGQQMKFTNITPAYLNEVMALTDELFPDTKIKKYTKGKGYDYFFMGKNTYRDRWHPFSAAVFARQMGLMHVLGPQKRIPKEIFESSDKIKCAFLNRYWAADGCVYLRSRRAKPAETGELFIGAETITQGQDFIDLLASLGIHSYMKLCMGKKSKHPFWKIMITQKESILTFFNTVGLIFGKEVKSKTLYDRCFSAQRMCFGVNRNNIRYTGIAQIAKLGSSQQMYDISVRKNKNFIANGFITHNSGKSTAVAAFIVWALYFGKGVVVNGMQHCEDIVVTAPSFPQAKLIFDRVKNHITRNEMLRSYVVGDMTIEKITVKNGNVCRVLSAGVSAQIRGYSPTRLICDEAGDIADNMMNAALLPMTRTTHASITKIGTPRTRNHFYLSAFEDISAHVIIQPYTDCPFIDAPSTEKLRSDKGGTMPVSLWRQEYGCEFLEEESSALPTKIVFPCFVDYACSMGEKDAGELPPVDPKGDYVAGVDLGRDRDSTVIYIIRRDIVPYTVVHTESHLHKPYTHLMGRLHILADHFKLGAINVDQTTEKGWGDLAAEVGVAINPITFNLANKEDMIANLHVLFEKKILLLPKEHELLYSQIIHQQYESTIYGRKSFFHPTDEHDDELWALALCAMALQIDVSEYNPNISFSGALESIAGYAPIARTHNFLDNRSLKEKDREKIREFLNSVEAKEREEEEFSDVVVGNRDPCDMHRKYTYRKNDTIGN